MKPAARNSADEVTALRRRSINWVPGRLTCSQCPGSLDRQMIELSVPKPTATTTSSRAATAANAPLFAVDAGTETWRQSSPSGDSQTAGAPASLPTATKPRRIDAIPAIVCRPSPRKVGWDTPRQPPSSPIHRATSASAAEPCSPPATMRPAPYATACTSEGRAASSNLRSQGPSGFAALQIAGARRPPVVEIKPPATREAPFDATASITSRAAVESCETPADGPVRQRRASSEIQTVARPPDSPTATKPSPETAAE
jgi:hypothetical protein